MADGDKDWPKGRVLPRKDYLGMVGFAAAWNGGASRSILHAMMSMTL
jgi:hypothetical protein